VVLLIAQGVQGYAKWGLIFSLRAVREAPFFVYALSKFYEIFLIIVFLLYANDYTIKLNLLSSRLLLMICFNTFGFSI